MRCEKCGHRRAKTGSCKFCGRIKRLKYQRSIAGKLAHRYRGMVQRSKRRAWPVPNFTREEFIEAFEKDPVFLHLYNEWKKSKYNKWKSPSIDRKDPDLLYQHGNTQWMTWEENFNKSQTTDHIRSDNVQLSLLSAPPPLWGHNEEFRDFTSRPQYFFDYGTFLCSRSQFNKIVHFDTKKEAAVFCTDRDYAMSRIREIAWLEPGKKGKTLIYKYGIRYKTRGFLTLPF